MKWNTALVVLSVLVLSINITTGSLADEGIIFENPGQDVTISCPNGHPVIRGIPKGYLRLRIREGTGYGNGEAYYLREDTIKVKCLHCGQEVSQEWYFMWNIIKLPPGMETNQGGFLEIMSYSVGSCPPVYRDTNGNKRIDAFDPLLKGKAAPARLQASLPNELTKFLPAFRNERKLAITWGKIRSSR